MTIGMERLFLGIVLSLSLTMMVTHGAASKSLSANR